MTERIAEVDDRVTLLKGRLDRLPTEILVVAAAAVVGILLAIYLIFALIDQQDQINDQRAKLVTAETNRAQADEAQRVAVCRSIQGLRTAFDVPTKDTTTSWSLRYEGLLAQLSVSAAALRC
jgi:hypothetical protein